MLVDHADMESYLRDGAVCIRGLLDKAWVGRIISAIDRIEQEPGPFRERYSPDDPGMFFSEKFMWTFDRDFRAFVFESGAAALVGGLMDATKVNIFYDHLMVKEPGTVTRTPWHQDLNYWPVEGRQICSLWVPFDPVGLENGGLEFVSGSHRWGNRYQPFEFKKTKAVETDEFEPLPDIESRREDLNILSWDLEPGDAVVFDALILHGASGNTTATSRRRALSTRWAGDDARFVRRNKMIRLIRDPGLQPGDALDCDLFPVIWRRPD